MIPLESSDDRPAGGERAAVALLTAAAADSEVAVDLTADLLEGPDVHRVLVGFLLVERAAAWRLPVAWPSDGRNGRGDRAGLDRRPGHAQTFGELVEAFTAGRREEVRTRLVATLLGPRAEQAEFLMAAAYATAHCGIDISPLLQMWALEVASSPHTRGDRPT